MPDLLDAIPDAPPQAAPQPPAVQQSAQPPDLLDRIPDTPQSPGTQQSPGFTANTPVVPQQTPNVDEPRRQIESRLTDAAQWLTDRAKRDTMHATGFGPYADVQSGFSEGLKDDAGRRAAFNQRYPEFANNNAIYGQLEGQFYKSMSDLYSSEISRRMQNESDLGPPDPENYKDYPDKSLYPRAAKAYYDIALEQQRPQLMAQWNRAHGDDYKGVPTDEELANFAKMNAHAAAQHVYGGYLGQFAGGASEGLLGLLGGATRLAGNDQLSDRLGAAGQLYGQGVGQSATDQKLNPYGAGVARIAGQLAPTIAGAAATGGSSLAGLGSAGTLFTVQGFNNDVMAAKDAGLNDWQAHAVAMVKGAITAASGELLPAGSQIEKGLLAAVKQLPENIGRSIASMSIMDLGHAATDAISRIKPEALNPSELVDAVANSVAKGLVFGVAHSAASLAGQGIQAVRNRLGQSSNPQVAATPLQAKSPESPIDVDWEAKNGGLPVPPQERLPGFQRRLQSAQTEPSTNGQPPTEPPQPRRLGLPAPKAQVREITNPDDVRQWAKDNPNAAEAVANADVGAKVQPEFLNRHGFLPNDDAYDQRTFRWLTQHAIETGEATPKQTLGQRKEQPNAISQGQQPSGEATQLPRVDRSGLHGEAENRNRVERGPTNGQGRPEARPQEAPAGAEKVTPLIGGVFSQGERVRVPEFKSEATVLGDGANGKVQIRVHEATGDRTAELAPYQLQREGERPGERARDLPGSFQDRTQARIREGAYKRDIGKGEPWRREGGQEPQPDDITAFRKLHEEWGKPISELSRKEASDRLDELRNHEGYKAAAEKALSQDDEKTSRITEELRLRSMNAEELERYATGEHGAKFGAKDFEYGDLKGAPKGASKAERDAVRNKRINAILNRDERLDFVHGNSSEAKPAPEPDKTGAWHDSFSVSDMRGLLRRLGVGEEEIKAFGNNKAAMSARMEAAKVPDQEVGEEDVPSEHGNVSFDERMYRAGMSAPLGPGAPNPPPPGRRGGGSSSAPSPKPAKSPALADVVGPIVAGRQSRDMLQENSSRHFEEATNWERALWGDAGRLNRMSLAKQQDEMIRYNEGRPPRKSDGSVDADRQVRERELNRYAKEMYERTKPYTKSTSAPLENWTHGMYHDDEGNVGFVGNRTIEGDKSWSHMKTFRTAREAKDAGYTPVSNFITQNLYALREMHKFLAAQEWLKWAKDPKIGIARFALAGSQTKEGYEEMSDKIGQIFHPNTHEIKVAVDQGMWDAMERAYNALGGTFTESHDLDRWQFGYTKGNTANIKLGDLLTGLHELGHVADNKLDLVNKLGIGPRGPLESEAVKLAAQRLFPLAVTMKKVQYVTHPQEMAANAIYAYTHAPDLFQQVAPKLKQRLEEVIDQHPELHPIRDITPSLQQGIRSATIEKPGIVKLGSYHVPAQFNHYLNSLFGPSVNSSVRKLPIPSAVRSLVGGVWKGYNTLSGAIKATRLFGLFHMPQTAALSIVTDVSQGLRKTERGLRRAYKGLTQTDIDELVKGLGTAGMGAAKALLSTPLAPAKIPFNLLKGAQIAKDVANQALPGWKRQPLPGNREVSAEHVFGGGGRANADPLHSAEQAYRNALDDLRHAPDLLQSMPPLVRMAWNDAMATLQTGMHPIMRAAMYAKLYSVNEMMSESLAGMKPEDLLDPEKMRRVQQQVWTVADEIFGQVVWDRVGLSRIMKQAAQATIQSPGWTGGSLLLAGRAAVETVGLGRGGIGKPPKPPKGQSPPTGGMGPPNKPLPPHAAGGDAFDAEQAKSYMNPERSRWITNRMAYLMALGIVSAIGNAIYQGIKAKKKLGEGGGLDQFVKDATFPRNGEKTADGSEARSRLIGYVGDYYSWLTHPFTTAINKLAPGINLPAQQIKGTDYFGNENRGLLPDLGEAVTPFSARNTAQRLSQKGGVSSAIESVLGVTPAPAEVTRSKAMNIIADYKRLTHTPQTVAQQDKSAARRQAEKEANDAEEGLERHVKAQVEAGKLTSKQAKDMLTKSKTQPLVQAVKGVPLDVSLEAYKARSTEEDTPELKAAMQAKFGDALKRAKGADIPDLMEKAKAAGLDTEAARQSAIKSLNSRATLGRTKESQDASEAALKALKATGQERSQAATEQKVQRRISAALGKRRLQPAPTP